MKNVWSLIGKASFLFGFCVFYSCKSEEDNTAILEQIDEGLVQSNKQIRLQTDDILHGLAQKVEDSKTAFKAKQIHPKALAIHAQTDSLIAYIDSLKSVITNVAVSQQKSKQEKSKDNDESVRKVFGNENSAAQLHGKLQQYRRIVMETDERIKAEIPELIVLVNKRSDSTNGSETVLKEMFEHSSAMEAIAYLNRIENNIVIDEKHLIAFLDAQVTNNIFHYDVYEAIVGQNAQVLKAGNDLEITAGVGAFKSQQLTAIKINSKVVDINERSYVVYRLKTSSKRGSYSVPVEIQFTDLDGNVQKRTITVEYKTVSANLK